MNGIQVGTKDVDVTGLPRLGGVAVCAWFLGLNPQLDDRSPAQSIREGDFRDVLVAAKAFLAWG